MRADILLKSDRNGPGWTDAQIAEAFGGRGQTGSNVGKRFVVGERLAAFARQRQSRPSHVRKVEGQGEARLIALGCSDPPEGSLNGRFTSSQIASLTFRLLSVSRFKPFGRR